MLHFKAVNYFFKSYETHKAIAEMDPDIMLFSNAVRKPPTKYTETLLNKKPRCDRAYDNYVRERVFIERLLESNRRSIYSNWGSEENSTIHDLIRNENSFKKLQHTLERPYSAH